jgi:L-histidine N-alpha-methyltransferase
MRSCGCEPSPKASKRASLVRIHTRRGMKPTSLSAVPPDRSEHGLAAQETACLEEDVRRGLARSPKALPPRLFYDDEGSRLFERITELPEYYLARAERAILAARADEIVDLAIREAGVPLTVVELGAGSASKTELLLAALLRRQATGLYVPVDVSSAALDAAAARLSQRLPAVMVRPMVATHERALLALSALPGPVLVLFIGSSIGNLDDLEGVQLLHDVRAALGADAALVLGTDLQKSPDLLLPAYDDAAGVTAAFNKNVLVRINRELGGHFDLGGFRHLARWNERQSRIEMHLESLVDQDVRIDSIGMSVRFNTGETIHTESSVKYDLERARRLLHAGGFLASDVYFDRDRYFAVHLAYAAP